MALFICDAEAAVDLHLALVVDPRHAEHDHALRLDHPLQDVEVGVLGVASDGGLDPLEHFLDRLQEDRLMVALLLDRVHDDGDFRYHAGVPFSQVPFPVRPSGRPFQPPGLPRTRPVESRRTRKEKGIVTSAPRKPKREL